MAAMLCVMLSGVMMVNVTSGAAETQYLFYFQDGEETQLYYAPVGSVESAMKALGKTLG